MQPVDQAILAEPLNGLLFQLNGQPWVYATSLATSELVGYARSASITDAQRGTINTLFGIDIRQAVTLTRELITELTATDTGILFDEDGNLKTHDALDDTFDIFEAAIVFDTYMTDNAATRNTFNTYFGIDPTLQVFTNPDYRDRLFAIVGDLDYADPATFFADLTSFDAAIADFMDADAAFTAAEQANIDIALAAYVDENGVSLNVSDGVQPVDQAILAEPLNGLLFQLNGQPWVYATSLATSELVGYARSASITDAQRGTINTLFGIDIRQAVTLTRELITELTATDTGILFDEDGNLKTHDALDDTFDIFEAAIVFDTYMTDNAATRNTFNTYFGIDPTLQVFTNPDYRDRLFAIVGDLD